MRPLGLILLLVLTSHAITVAASHDVGVGGFAIERKIEQPDQQLAEVEAASVTMRCFTGEDGHRITIAASNPGNQKRACQSRCYYRTSSGLTGLFYAAAIVPAELTDIELRTDYFADFAVSITNPGSFSCK